MVIQYVISVILLILGTIAHALHELAGQGKLDRMQKASPTGFFGAHSYERKYKIPNIAAPNNWYYRWNEIHWKERFPGSATIFVSFTDFYHLSQAIAMYSLCGAAAALTSHWLIAFLVIRVTFGVFFTVAYKRFGS